VLPFLEAVQAPAHERRRAQQPTEAQEVEVTGSVVSSTATRLVLNSGGASFAYAAPTGTPLPTLPMGTLVEARGTRKPKRRPSPCSRSRTPAAVTTAAAAPAAGATTGPATAQAGTTAEETDTHGSQSVRTGTAHAVPAPARLEPGGSPLLDPSP
jgi:hypothetical protein